MRKERSVVELVVKTLILSDNPSVATLVLIPKDDEERVGTHRVLPIWMGSLGASIIGYALSEKRHERPMTHDLMLDALTNLDAFVDHMLITNVKGGTFYAKLTLRQHGRLIELDARPSDAIALCIRQQAPVYMLDEIFNQASFPYIIKNDTDPDRELENFHAFLEDLTPDDFER